MIYLLTAPVSGPVNVTAPYPVTNAEFITELGHTLGRPTPWIVPGFALHAILGEFAVEILNGQRAVPTKLYESGFEFRYRTLPEALAAELG
jgi:NAD dependent epimerase/dehydratase family enzyme